jgi:hypothetical protein
MLTTNVKNKNKWLWKEYRIARLNYLILECFMHQAPLYYLIINKNRTGNALASVIPVSIYCTFINNPYKLAGYKLKNYYGIAMIFIVAPIVNVMTRKYSTKK